MPVDRLRTVVAAGLLSITFLLPISPAAQSPTIRTYRVTRGSELRSVDTEITQLIRQGQLTVSTDRDHSLPSRTIERMQQTHHGVPVFGMTAIRDSDRGLAMSVFGMIAPDLGLSTDPSLTPDEARTALLAALGGEDPVTQTGVELSILPLASGDYRLAYTAVLAGQGRILRIFVDAHSGSELLRF